LHNNFCNSNILDNKFCIIYFCVFCVANFQQKWQHLATNFSQKFFFSDFSKK
jgi:hypothetical protein